MFLLVLFGIIISCFVFVIYMRKSNLHSCESSKKPDIEKYHPSGFVLCGYVLSIIGISILIAVYVSNFTKISDQMTMIFLGLATLIVGIACLITFRIKCNICGYDGNAKNNSLTRGLIFTFLLCMGLIPGLVYLVCQPKKYVCPKCGLIL